MKLPSGNQPLFLQCHGPHCHPRTAGRAISMSAFGPGRTCRRAIPIDASRPRRLRTPRRRGECLSIAQGRSEYMRPRAAAPNLVGMFFASPLCDMLLYSSQLLMHRPTRCRVEPWLKLSFRTEHLVLENWPRLFLATGTGLSYARLHEVASAIAAVAA